MPRNYTPDYRSLLQGQTYGQDQLRQLDHDWQLYNYAPSGRDDYQGVFTHNPLLAGGRHAGPSMDGLLPQNWGAILSLNEDLLRQRGYTGPVSWSDEDATQGDIQAISDWMRTNGLVVGQSGPLKDGLARHGNYYTQLFDANNSYAPVGQGYRLENDYAADGAGILSVLLAAVGGAALAPAAAPAGAGAASGATNAALIESALGTAGYGVSSATPGFAAAGGAAASAGGGLLGTGGASTTGTLGATSTTVPTLASAQIPQIMPVIGGMSPIVPATAGLTTAGAVTAADGGAALVGNSDKAALLSDAGYGAGMSGNATSAFDTVAGLTGNNQLGAAAGNAVDGNWLQAAQNVGNSMNMTDWLRLGTTIYGAVQGNKGTPAQTQTNQRSLDPRLDAVVFGQNGQGGLLSDAQAWYQANKSGQNATMRTAQQQMQGLLTDPRLTQGLYQMGGAGLGLLSQPIAGNPYANGQTPLYQAPRVAPWTRNGG